MRSVPIAFLLAALLQVCALSAFAAGAARSLVVESALETRPGAAPILRLRFETIAGLQYRLRVSDDLAEWSDAGPSVVGDGAAKEFEAALGEGARFFDVAASLGPAFASETTGIVYPVRVYTPAGYGSGAKLYPIIYATDGQWYSEGYADAIRRKGKEAILVAIEQGPGDRRAIDYTLPGARAYFEFLKTELLPAVESLYRVDPGRRALSGASYGGLFVGAAMLLDDPQAPLFGTFLSFDGAYWRGSSLMQALESERAAKGLTLKATLFLTSTTGIQGNDSSVAWFQSRLANRGYQGLVIHRKLPPYTLHHNDVGQPSFEAALDLLY